MVSGSAGGWGMDTRCEAEHVLGSNVIYSLGYLVAVIYLSSYDR
jgi:hypothetical protein